MEMPYTSAEKVRKIGIAHVWNPLTSGYLV